MMNDEKMSLEEVNQAIDEAIDASACAEESFPIRGGVIHTLLSICPFVMIIVAVLVSSFKTGVEAEIKSWGLLIVGSIIWLVCNVFNLFYYVRNSLETYELIALKEEMLNESKDSV